MALHLFLAAAIVTIPLAPAMAEDAGSAAVLTFKDYPKPWPFRNLVEPGTLTVAVTTDIPPASFIDPKSGKVVGYVSEMIEKMADDLGLKVQSGAGRLGKHAARPCQPPLRSGLRRRSVDAGTPDQSRASC